MKKTKSCIATDILSYVWNNASDEIKNASYLYTIVKYTEHTNINENYVNKTFGENVMFIIKELLDIETIHENKLFLYEKYKKLSLFSLVIKLCDTLALILSGKNKELIRDEFFDSYKHGISYNLYLEHDTVKELCDHIRGQFIGESLP